VIAGRPAEESRFFGLQTLARELESTLRRGPPRYAARTPEKRPGKAIESPTHPARSRAALGEPLLIVGRIHRS
jgi:hypothetical protein